MSPTQKRLPTILHLSKRRRVPAAIALAAIVLVLPVADEASAMGFGGGFRGNFGTSHSFGRNTFNPQRMIRPPPTTRVDNPGRRRVLGQAKTANRNSEGGKVA